MWKSEQFAWLKDKACNKYSQFGEDGILAAIFDRIGTENRWVMECGAADGLFFSNSRKLIEQEWSAVLIEGDREQYAKLSNLYPIPHREGQTIATLCAKITPNGRSSFDQVLSLWSTASDWTVPEDLDLAVIDVDGADYWLFNSLLKYRPRVVMVEYDPAADPDFIPPMGGEGQAGLQAIIKLGIGKYYWPVVVTSTNVIFVQQELVGRLAEKPAEETLEGFFDRFEKHIADGIAKRPPRGKARNLHQAQEGTDAGHACGKPMMEECSGQQAAPRVSACASTPRFGPLATMDCILQAIVPLGINWYRGEGAFWHHSLSRAIKRALNDGADFIVTFDYDTVFDFRATSNDIARLICLMVDNPDVDVIVAAQMKREGGPLLASTAGEVKLLEPLVPITQGHFGLTIFRRSVFDRIEKPWFWEQANENGDWEENRTDADIGFWKRCQDAGINVQMSLDVLVGHIEVVVTWPGQNLKPHYQPMNDWRENGKPAEAFDRQRVLAAISANPALLYGAKLDMGG